MAIRYQPEHPDRAFPLDAFTTDPGDALASKAWGLFVVGGLGLFFWWFGAGLIVRGLPRPHRLALTWLPVLLLPWWGHELDRVLGRLLPEAGELARSAVGTFASSAAVPAAGPVEWAEAQSHVWTPARSEFADLLARIDLSAPGPRRRMSTAPGRR